MSQKSISKKFFSDNVILCKDLTVLGNIIGNVSGAPIVEGNATMNIDMNNFDITNANLVCANLIQTDVIEPKNNGNVTLSGDLCINNILYTGNLAGKSPINVLDELYITSAGNRINFEGNIKISGNSSNAIAIGGNSIVNGDAAIGLGKETKVKSFTGIVESSGVSGPLITQGDLTQPAWVETAPAELTGNAMVAFFATPDFPTGNLEQISLITDAVGTFQIGMFLQATAPNYAIGFGPLLSLNTTIASGSNGIDLITNPGVINVASTAEFPSPNGGQIHTVYVTTSAGVQQVTYTGLTATQFTGVVGGTGIMSTGGAVTSGGLGQAGSVYTPYLNTHNVGINPGVTGTREFTSGMAFPFQIPVGIAGKSVSVHYPINVPANGEDYYFNLSFVRFNILDPSDTIEFWIASSDGTTDLALIYSHTDLVNLFVHQMGPQDFLDRDPNPPSVYKVVDFNLGAYSSSTVSFKITVTNNSGNFLFFSALNTSKMDDVFSEYYPQTTIKPDNSIAIGCNSEIQNGANNSIVIGDNSIVTRDCSVSVGSNLNNTSIKSVCVGYNSTLTQPYGISIGAYNNPGYKGVNMGRYCQTTAYKGIAIGTYSYAYTGSSIALGHGVRTFESNTSAYGSIAMGYYSYSYQSGGIVIGTYSYTFDNVESVRAVVIGTNSYTLDSSSVAMGYNAFVQNLYGIGIGYNVSVAGQSSIVIGTNASTAYQDSIAIGNSATTAYQESIAIGPDATTAYQQSIAIGKSATTYYGYSIAIGLTSSTNGYNSIAIGKDTKARGYADVIVGPNAAQFDYTPYGGGFNVIIGYDTFSYGGTGGSHIAIGDTALRGRSTWDRSATNQIGIGQFALAYNNSDFALGIGVGALQGDFAYTNTGFTSEYSIAIGHKAMQKSGGNCDVSLAMGTKSLYNVNGDLPTEGLRNVAIGHRSGYSLTRGSLNVLIGHETSTTNVTDIRGTGLGYSAETTNRAVAIGAFSQASHDSSICIGHAVRSRVDNEFSIPGNRVIRHTLTTTDGTPTTYDYPINTDENISFIDVFVSATEDGVGGTKTGMFTLKDGGVVNKTGTLTLINPTKTVLLKDDPNLDANLTISGTNIRITVTGNVGETYDWTIILDLHPTFLS